MNSRQSDLTRELTVFIKYFEPYFQKYFEKKIKESLRFSPLISRFYQDLADFSSGGKRMRAFLVYLGYLVGENKDTPFKETPLKGMLPICLAMEIIHSFLLIHDDIIDKSETRHGGPTIHKRYEKLMDSPPRVDRLASRLSGRQRVEAGHYGISQAIILGDIACFEALELINTSDFKDELKVTCERQLLSILRETGYGEALDVESTYRGGTLARIRQVMDLKTARYSFVGPLIIGATLGGVRERQIKGLVKFGHSCGMAFQLRDDILGVFGDEKIIGKPLDFLEGKNTILIFKTYELAGASEKASLRRIWGRRKANSTDLKLVQKVIKDCGALEWCEKEQLKLARAAKNVIGDITSNKRLQIILGQIVDFVIKREK